MPIGKDDCIIAVLCITDLDTQSHNRCDVNFLHRLQIKQVMLWPQKLRMMMMMLRTEDFKLVL